MSQLNRRRKPIASTVDPELWENLREFSIKSRIPASRLLDEAIEDILLKYHAVSQKDEKS